MPSNLCPECTQGKTVNCVGQAMDENDELVICYTAVRKGMMSG